MAGPKDQIPAIYARALKKYQEITDETLDVGFLSRLQNVDDLMKEIDARNTQFGEFREKRRVLFDVLKSALIPIQLFGDLAAGGASMVFPPSSLVFGAVTYLMSAARGVSSSFDAIQCLMGSLKDFTIRLKAYSKESISEDLGDKLADILVTLLEIFALSTKAIRRGRLLKFTRNFLLGDNDAIKAAVGKLDDLTRVEAHLVGAETLTESKRTGRVVDDISVTVSATSATVTKTGTTVNQMSMQVNDIQGALRKLALSVNEAKQESSEDREKALQALVPKILRPSKTDSAQDEYDKISKTRISGTGDWIRDEEIFKVWLARETPVIFISGNPGAGKSYLSANIISFLMDHYPQHVQSTEMISIGYFFFKDDNPDTRSFHQALRDLALQISKNDPVYQRYLSTIEDYGRISTIESAWRLLFVEYFLRNPNVESYVYIVLDGVDEAFDEERRTFLTLAKDLYDASEKRLQLAIVGRPHISDQLLEGLEVEASTIHVTRQKNSADIDSYIQASIKKSVVLRRVSAKLRKEIVDTLSAGAEGMFLWVNLMLQELVRKRNESSMRKVLEHPPKGLKEILRHVLTSFSASSDEEELEYLNEILLWVTCSQHPLTLHEIEEILKLKSPEGDGMIYLEGALRGRFAAFFSVDRDDGLTTAELQNMATRPDLFGGSDDGKRDEDEEVFEDVENFTDFNSDGLTSTVRLSHASIGDFLRDETQGKVSAGEGFFAVGVNYREAKAHVLKTCLRLFTDPYLPYLGDYMWISNHAALNWAYHLSVAQPSECSSDDREIIAKMLLEMFRDEEVMTIWIDPCSRDCSWLPTEANLQAIRSWWKADGVVATLTQDEQDFISSTEAEPITAFKPLVMFCVKKWLREKNWDITPLVSIVCSYQALAKGKEINNLKPTADELVEAAEVGDSEKDGLWYRQCAMALRQVGHHEIAFEYFAQALKLDPDDYLARGGLAMTYVRQGEWQQAVQLDEQTARQLSAEIRASPEDEERKENLHTTLERMANCYEKLQDGNRQFEAIKQAYDGNRYCNRCLIALLCHYSINHDHTATMELLQMLADTLVPRGFSQLTYALSMNANPKDDFLVFVADAALATDRLDFLVESWKTAIRVARKSLKTVNAAQLELGLARIYSEFLHDQATAVNHWERIMNTYSSSKDETNIGKVKLEASFWLARQFLFDAVEAGVGTLVAAAAAAKLEKMVKHIPSHSDSVLYTLASARSIMLGVYYRLNGQEAEARAQFRPSIKRGIQILSDDDPKNDIYGLVDLHNSLAGAGDTKNVIAVSYACGNLSAGEECPASWTWTCDGPCRRTNPVLDGWSRCPICFDTTFCPDCVELLQQGTIRIARCSRKHIKDFIYIPPQPRDFDKGAMLVDGEVMDFDVWKNLLKKEWDV
ncbi:NACHT and TPR domain protein [Aspergillus undulatus]|uniref:NACHT and TPR domain protein n=1 Tax=Aspergillus undulatus TaxID=1810928 RepID=UPI003CCCED0A